MRTISEVAKLPTLRTVSEQKEHLQKVCRRVIIDGKTVLIAPKGLSVTTKTFINF